ncbi:MAG TPA: DUF3486 family protein [Thiobacillaceae bacterium]|nr:DUF3486 family protein [Thiobacillaceae bacterium]
MGRASSIQRLDPRIREAVDAAIREGRATIADIVDLVHGMGGHASKSAVHRYRVSVEAQMEHYRQAQALARVWVEQIPDQGDVAQLTRQVLSVLAFRAAGDMGEGEVIEGKEVAWLARALKDIAASAKQDVDTRRALRAEIEAEQQARLATVAKARSLDAATLAAVREALYGA